MFGQLHASWYDRWHGTKDYRSEVDQLCQVFGGEVHSVLDLGCGTARHLELLAQAGFEVTGVDRAAGMVEAAGKRLAPFGSRARVVQSEVTGLDLDRTFDAVIMMFSVLGYHVTDADMFAVLEAAHRHLAPGGLLAFDILDGYAVIRGGVLSGCSVVEDGSAQLVRGSRGRLYQDEQIYEIDMRLWAVDGDRLVATEQETHPIRYFLPREIRLVLDVAGFEVAGSEPLAGAQAGPTREWTRLYWARRNG